jgi:hypothetical protein
MDEKGFLLGVINRTKRVFDVNAKRQGKLLGASQDGNRSWITFLACICQDMTSLPPFLIYQGKPGQVQDTWLTDFDPEHQSTFFSMSETGWTSHELGKEWLVGVFDRFMSRSLSQHHVYPTFLTNQPQAHSLHREQIANEDQNGKLGDSWPYFNNKAKWGEAAVWKAKRGATRRETARWTRLRTASS